jgi:Uma2 family endonuclease
MPHLIEPPTRTMPRAELPRIRWNVEQFESLCTMGLLPKREYELIEGDIIEKMSIKHPHAAVITLLFALFSRITGFPLLLSQFSLWIDDETLPEPDFAVLAHANPTLTTRGYVEATNLRLVVEVSDATLSQDVINKAVLYARANIPEYWVIDVVGRRLLLHSAPGTDGYTAVTEYSDTDTAAPLFAPTATFPISDILP